MPSSSKKAACDVLMLAAFNTNPESELPVIWLSEMVLPPLNDS
jgi:hypothetical protein